MTYETKLVGYLLIGTILAVFSSRRLHVFDQALALVLFWPVFSVAAFLSVVVRSIEGLIKSAVAKFRKK